MFFPQQENRPAAGPCGLLREKGPGGGSGDGFSGAPGKNPEDAPMETGIPGGDNLLCRCCGHIVTRTQARVVVYGAHCHVFCNPHGHVFEIGCFGSAPGCTHAGPPSFEFSWFAGYSWQIALCGACRSHLGWCFRQAEGGEFYGLILRQLVEEPGE